MKGRDLLQAIPKRQLQADYYNDRENEDDIKTNSGLGGEMTSMYFRRINTSYAKNISPCIRIIYCCMYE